MQFFILPITKELYGNVVQDQYVFGYPAYPCERAIGRMDLRMSDQLLNEEEFTKKYGEIKEVIVDTMEHIVMETKYVDEKGNVLGYWVHGYFEPEYPYQGQF